MKSFLRVPVQVRDRAYGNLYLTEEDADFDAVDEESLVIPRGMGRHRD